MMETPETKFNFFRFEDLRIYEKSIEYIRWLYSVTPKTDNEYQVKLFQQLLQSGQAIATNIAEGASRNKTQFMYYLRFSKAAVNECVTYTEVASRIGVLSDAQREYSRNQLMEMTKMLGSLVSSLNEINKKVEVETSTFSKFPD